MDIRKKLILLTLILLIALLIIVLLVTKLNKKDDLSNVIIYDPIVPPVSEEIEQKKGKLQYLENRGELDKLRTCLQKFYSQCVYDEEYDNSELLYKMLAPQYINYKNITMENVRQSIKAIKESNVYIYDAYYLTNYSSVYSFFVKGELRTVDNEFTSFYNIVNINLENSTFEIILDDYAANYDTSDDMVGKEIEFNVPEKIEKNKYNTFSNTSQKTEEMVSSYFNMYRNLLLYNIESAKSLLVNGSTVDIDQLESFVTNNKNSVFLMSYGTYEVNVIDGETVRYRAYDKKAEYYIDIYVNSKVVPRFDIGKLN